MRLCALCRTMAENVLYTIASLAFCGYIGALAVLGMDSAISADTE